MELPIYQIDAFTNRPFGGNPAAVVLLDEWLDTKVMQSIAAENNLSETAFVVKRDGYHDLRWFTPTLEIDLCGHATLASGYVLFNEGLENGDRIRFETQKAGSLEVSRRDDLITLDFPSRPPEPTEVTDLLAEALGARPLEAHGARDLLCLFETQEDVLALAPRFDRMLALGAFAVIATAPGRDSDFVSRFFAPKAGVPEDPVTGSAHCTLTPFWSQRLGKNELHAFQVSRRRGELFLENRGDRVLISGRAVKYLRGTIRV